MLFLARGYFVPILQIFSLQYFFPFLEHYMACNCAIWWNFVLIPLYLKRVWSQKKIIYLPKKILGICICFLLVGDRLRTPNQCNHGGEIGWNQIEHGFYFERFLVDGTHAPIVTHYYNVHENFFSVQTLMADHQMCTIINATILQQKFFFKSVKNVVIHFF